MINHHREIPWWDRINPPPGHNPLPRPKTDHGDLGFHRWLRMAEDPSQSGGWASGGRAAGHNGTRGRTSELGQQVQETRRRPVGQLCLAIDPAL